MKKNKNLKKNLNRESRKKKKPSNSIFNKLKRKNRSSKNKKNS